MPAAVAPAYLAALILVFARTSAILLVAPLTGHRAIPVLHRAGLALALALVLAPVAPVRPPSDGANLALAIGGEVVVGLAIGGTVALVFAAVQSAGELLGFQMGLSVASAWDPALGQQVNPLTRFHDALALLVFLAVDGHHLLLRTLAASFHGLPTGTLALVATDGLVALGGRVLGAGLEIAAPVTGVLFAVNAMIALSARVAPQLNVFGVGVPVTLAVGLFAAVETLPHWAGVLTRLLTDLGGDLARLLGAGRGL